MELNTISQGDFVKLANVLWYKGLTSVPRVMRESGMFNISSIPQNSGNTREFSEIDLEEYADNKGESAQSERAKTQQGYSKIMGKKRVSKDIGISYEMRTENKANEVVRRLTNLGGLVDNRQDLDLAHRVTFATATSYEDKNGATVDTTMGDGFSLAYTAHTVRGSATTYRNRVAANPRISVGALQSMEKLIITESINQFGEKISMNHDVLFTTDDPEDVDMANEILKSTAALSAGNSGVINVKQAKYTHKIFPRVATDKNGANDSTKANYWGLFASMFSQAHLGVWEEARLKTPPADGNSGEEFSTDDWNFGARGGYGITIVSGAFFKFSSGDGVA